MAAVAITALTLTSLPLLRAETTNDVAALRKKADQTMAYSTNANGPDMLSGERAHGLLSAARMYKSIGDTNAWRRASERAAELYAGDLYDTTPVNEAKAIYLELGEPEKAVALQLKADSARRQLKKTIANVVPWAAGLLIGFGVFAIRQKKDRESAENSERQT